MKCSRCRNEVARIYTEAEICSTCFAVETAVETAGEGQPMAPRLSRVEVDAGPGAVLRETDGVRPGSTLIDEAEQKIARRPGRPARRRSDPRPKVTAKIKSVKPPKVKLERFPKGAGEVKAVIYDKELYEARHADKASQPNGDEELPEKEIVLSLNAAQWRILRKLLVRGLHGDTVEDVCKTLINFGLELAARKVG